MAGECLANNPDLVPKNLKDKVMEKISGKFESACTASVTAEAENIVRNNVDIAGVASDEMDRPQYFKTTAERQKKVALSKWLDAIYKNSEDPVLQQNIKRITASLSLNK